MRKTPTKPARAATADELGWGGVLVIAGLAAALVGLPLAVDPAGYNPHTAAKALCLSAAVALIAAGFVLEPDLLRGAIARLGSSPLARVLAVVGALALASWGFSIDPSQSFVGSYPDYQGLLSFAAYGAVAAGAVAVMHGPDARAMLGRTITAGVLALAGLVLASRTGIDPLGLGAGAGERAFATLGSASTLGAYLVIVLPLVAERAARDRGAWRIVAALAVLAGTAALLLTSSRGAWVGALAALVVGGAFLLREGDRAVVRRVALAVLAIVLAAAAVLWLAPGVRDRAASALDTTDSTVAWRLSVWETTLDLSVERPLLGWGPNSFRFAFPPVRAADTNLESISGFFVTDPHNLTLAAAVSLGWPATAGLSLVIALAFFQAWRTREGPNARAYATSDAAALAGGLVALQFHLLTFSTGVLLAVLIALRATAREPRAARQESTSPTLAAGRALVPWRLAGAAALLPALAGVLLAGGLLVADRNARTAFEFAAAGASWDTVAGPIEAARSAAPWEPVFDQMAARAALLSASMRYDEAAIAYGTAAATTACQRLPHEAGPMCDLGGLLLARALETGDTALAETALALYEEASAMDPSDPDHWIGMGRCGEALDDSDGAVIAYERAVELAPFSQVTWEYLADAYDAAGRPADAEAARSHEAPFIHP